MRGRPRHFLARARFCGPNGEEIHWLGEVWGEPGLNCWCDAMAMAERHFRAAHPEAEAGAIYLNPLGPR